MEKFSQSRIIAGCHAFYNGCCCHHTVVWQVGDFGSLILRVIGVLLYVENDGKIISSVYTDNLMLANSRETDLLMQTNESEFMNHTWNDDGSILRWVLCRCRFYNT